MRDRQYLSATKDHVPMDIVSRTVLQPISITLSAEFGGAQVQS